MGFEPCLNIQKLKETLEFLISNSKSLCWCLIDIIQKVQLEESITSEFLL